MISVSGTATAIVSSAKRNRNARRTAIVASQFEHRTLAASNAVTGIAVREQFGHFLFMPGELVQSFNARLVKLCSTLPGCKAHERMTRFSAAAGFLTALATFAFVLLLLVTGSPLLVMPIGPGLGVPFGNVITWIGMLALVMLPWFGWSSLRSPHTTRDRNYRRAWSFLLLLALLWPVISYGLAGNWSFSFQRRDSFRGGPTAALWFFRYSFAVVVLPVLFAIVRIVHSRLFGTGTEDRGTAPNA
jgi:hypothetical protein